MKQVQFSISLLEKLKKQSELSNEEIEDLRTELFAQLLNNLDLNVETLTRHDCTFSYYIVDRYKDFFEQYFAYLKTLVTIPLTPYPKKTHLWCLHVFKYICKAVGFECVRKSNDHFSLQSELNEICKRSGLTIMDVVK